MVAAVIEAHHDEKGIVWPLSVAPFDVGLLNLRFGDKTCDALAESVYQQLQAAGVMVLYDDRGMRAGVQFADMDLIGLPWQCIVAPQLAKQNRVELKWRRDGQRMELSLADAVVRIKDSLGGNGAGAHVCG